MKADQWIGGDRSMQLGSEHDFIAAAVVIAAGEFANQIARQHLAVGAGSITGFHRVLDQYADFNRFAAFGIWGDSDECASHGISPQCTRPA